MEKKIHVKHLTKSWKNTSEFLRNFECNFRQKKKADVLVTKLCSSIIYLQCPFSCNIELSLISFDTSFNTY